MSENRNSKRSFGHRWLEFFWSLSFGIWNFKVRYALSAIRFAYLVYPEFLAGSGLRAGHLPGLQRIAGI
jgi:hypothetical protein